jgi:hypothetical protein
MTHTQSWTDERGLEVDVADRRSEAGACRTANTERPVGQRLGDRRLAVGRLSRCLDPEAGMIIGARVAAAVLRSIGPLVHIDRAADMAERAPRRTRARSASAVRVAPVAFVPGARATVEGGPGRDAASAQADGGGAARRRRSPEWLLVTSPFAWCVSGAWVIG